MKLSSTTTTIIVAIITLVGTVIVSTITASTAVSADIAENSTRISVLETKQSYDSRTLDQLLAGQKELDAKVTALLLKQNFTAKEIKTLEELSKTEQ